MSVGSGQPAANPAGVISTQRILAIDVFRGFALFFSFISVPLYPALKQLPVSLLRDLTMSQLSHADWNGFTFLDWGFPAYLFLIGVSLVFSMRKRKAAGRLSAVRELTRRCVVLWFFSFMIHDGFAQHWGSVDASRFFYVLTVCIYLTGLIELLLSRRMQIGLLFVILLAHWGLLALIPVPGYGAGHFGISDNAQYYLRDQVTAWMSVYINPAYLSGKTIFNYLIIWRQISCCLCGLCAGHLLASNRSVTEKGVWLVLAGAAAVILAFMWNQWLPINKLLWTPSFVLITTGCSCLFIGGTILAAEVRQVRGWTKFFVVFGRYPLAAWCVYGLFPFQRIAHLIMGEMLAPLFGVYHEVCLAFLQVMLCWTFFYWVDKNRLSFRWDGVSERH